MQLYLTPKSQPILEEIHARAADMMAEAVDGVSAAAQKQVFESLQRIKQNLATTEPKSEDDMNGRKNDVGRTRAPRLRAAR